MVIRDEILKIENLLLRFYTYEGVVEALDGIDLGIKAGEVLGLVGETGCGKSVTSLSIMGLVPAPGVIEGGKIIYTYNGKPVDLVKQKDSFLREIRGDEVAMVFQEPRAYLNPVYTVEYQIGEALLQHRKKEMLKMALDEIKKAQEKQLNKKLKNIETEIEKLKMKGEKENQEKIKELTERIEQLKSESSTKRSFTVTVYEKMLQNPDSLYVRFLAKIPLVNRFKKWLKHAIKQEVIRILKSMQIADPQRVAEMYPHELSGGMAQRVMIAMALACNPTLLICDEPTTNLDVTVQAQILELIKYLKETYKSSILYITHDLGVVAQLCERVAVMYAGNVVELADVNELFKEPMHPYTTALLESIPRPGKELKSIPGMVPSLINPPKGCRFHTRCSYAMPICQTVKPEFLQVKEDHFVACHLYGGHKK
ncbi:MAG: ABC transporter ATP-binding protein [Candidatus Bathyarchaeota archaeon]|jgi:peptide/nickel transport system ATP-binding protein|nr:ABC transporter ATP-binding protein [Candidatus Bathyarchaeota archaeon A05DMB-5]MDH7557889.1 ABC transporter ATP-binding protein [Candidatus Bathyarchaeota archaeon]